MESGDLTKGRNLLAVAACVALIHAVCYFLAGATFRSDGAMAIAQPDTLLYCQAARRIAEGAPFSYSAGTAVSTGTTSVIHPFILAVPYFLGCKGDSLLTAGFVLNAVFYLLFVLGWVALACRAFAERPAARVLSAALLASFGPFAYCALAQSDTGLWLAVSAWLAYGLFTGRKGLYAPLLLLAPWVRPEGMIVALSFCVFCAFDSFRRRRFGKDVAVAVAAVASVAGVFVLNYALTGVCQFSSVAHKGHFCNLSLSSAVFASAIDFMRIVKAYLLGLPQGAPRDFFFLPLVGAAFMWIGIFSRSWRGVSWRECVWYLAIAGGVATVSTSGWQNTNLDRYLAWLLPVPILFCAFGADVVASRLTDRVARLMPPVLLAGFSGAMAIVFVGVFRHAVVDADPARAFAARCEAALPKGASLGAWGDAGAAYELSERRFAHLSAIYSPEFTASSPAAKLEILKNEPETRFDYWLCKASDGTAYFSGKADAAIGAPVLLGASGLELRKAEWAAFDVAAKAPPAPHGTQLRARLDVAYERDEKTYGYEALTLDDHPIFSPLHRVGALNGTNIVEGGRFLLGGDAMTLPLEPGRDVHVVMRTALKCTAVPGREIAAVARDFSFGSPMRLRVFVDGEDAGEVTFAVDVGDFADATFTIPGRFIARSPVRIAFNGEHVAFAYWFFQ